MLDRCDRLVRVSNVVADWKRLVGCAVGTDRSLRLVFTCLPEADGFFSQPPTR
jgi:hypothetical protein